jgi:hypothetical protein
MTESYCFCFGREHRQLANHVPSDASRECLCDVGKAESSLCVRLECMRVEKLQRGAVREERGERGEE